MARTPLLPLISLIALLVLDALPNTAQASAVREITSRHYRIQSDLDADLTDDLARRMDAMYEEYARRFSGAADLRNLPAFQVNLFHNRADYVRLVGESYKNTAGVFMPARRLLAACQEGQGRDEIRRTLQHEAFHQFVHEALPHDPPVWFNEGMAQIFEEGLWTGKDFWIGQAPPRRIRQLQADLKAGRLMDFATLAALSADQWAQALAGDGAKAATQYNQAWATVYFLMHFKDSSAQETYRPRLLELLQMLNDGVENAEAFHRVFPDAGIVQKNFLAYAKMLGPTVEATLIERQDILADLLTELSSHGPLPPDIPHLRRALQHGGYRVHYALGDVRWDSDADVKTYFSDVRGRPFAKSELLIDRSAYTALPDVVCRCFEGFQLRTRFHKSGAKVEHEVLIEPVPVERKSAAK